MVWMRRPWPLRIEPTMGSPGMGWQHLANWMAIPSVPRMARRWPLGRRGAVVAGEQAARRHRGQALARPMSVNTSAGSCCRCFQKLVPGLGGTMAGTTPRAINSWLREAFAEGGRLLVLHGAQEVADPCAPGRS